MNDLLLTNWIDVTIKKENEAILFLLLFKDENSCGNAMKTISSEPYSLEIKPLENNQTRFAIRFINSEYDVFLVSNLNTANYPPLGWIQENVPLYLSCGWKTSNAGFQMLQPFLKVSKLHLN